MSTERPGVYLIEHQPTGRVYVGGTANLSKRWSRHRAMLRDGTHRNLRLLSAWQMDGPGAFRWRILVITKDLIRTEQAVIDHYDATNPGRGFNIVRKAGPGGDTTPGHRSEAWRAALRATWSARTPEQRRAQTQAARLSRRRDV